MKFDIEFPDDEINKTVAENAIRAVKEELRKWTFSSRLIDETRVACGARATRVIEETLKDDTHLTKLVNDAIQKAIYQKVTAQVRKMDLNPRIIEAVLKLEK